MSKEAFLNPRLVVIALSGVLVACTRERMPANPPLLRVVASDYALAAASQPSAGFVSVRVVNQGHEMHHTVISSVPDSLSLSRFEALATAEPPSPLVQDVGGPNLTAPGDSSEAIVELAPGRYILSCWVNAADGKPHILHGMLSELRVAPGRAGPPPAASVVIRASDFAFDVRGPLRAGDNIIEFANDGPQEHDVQLMQLTAGQTIEDVKGWAEHGGVGAPALTPIAGASGIVPGRRVWFVAHLAPGRYAVFCFVPDIKDGKMHLLHGMLREIVVS